MDPLRADGCALLAGALSRVLERGHGRNVRAAGLRHGRLRPPGQKRCTEAVRVQRRPRQLAYLLAMSPLPRLLVAVALLSAGCLGGAGPASTPPRAADPCAGGGKLSDTGFRALM